MKKNQKYWVIGVAAIITILILWYVFKKTPAASPFIKTPLGGTGTTTATNTGTTNTSTGYPIRWMVFSGSLKPLQSALGVTADGYLGNDTVAALVKLGIDADSSYTIDNPTDLNRLISLASKSKNSGGISGTVQNVASWLTDGIVSTDNTSGNGDGTDAVADNDTIDNTATTTDTSSTDDSTDYTDYDV